MEVTGYVRHALEIRRGVSQRGNSWASREYVFEIPGQYPKNMVFTIFGEDKIKQFALKKDEQVTVQFDIDAHEWNGRWFNEIRAYNIIRPNQSAPLPPPSANPSPFGTQSAQDASPQPNLFPPAQPAQSNDDSSDLPF